MSRPAGVAAIVALIADDAKLASSADDVLIPIIAELERVAVRPSLLLSVRVTAGAPMKTPWLAGLAKHVKKDAAFFSEMHRQLEPSFRALVGEGLRDFLLMPPMKPIRDNEIITAPPFQEFRIATDERGSKLEGTLINAGYAAPVEITWSEEGGSLEFVWSRLPASDIRAVLTGRRDIPIRAEHPIRFRFGNPVWPHLELTLHFGRQIDAARVEELIHATIATWNERAEAATQDQPRGVFHNAGALRPIDDRTFRVRIDLGSTGLEALTHLLDRVAEQAPLEEVRFDS